MFELFKKSLLASLGAAVITRDKVIEATRKLVQEGKLNAEEAERLSQELIDSGKHQWEEVQENIMESVRRGLDNLDIGSKKEFQDLKAKVENLSNRVAILEDVINRQRSEGSGP